MNMRSERPWSFIASNPDRFLADSEADLRAFEAAKAQAVSPPSHRLMFAAGAAAWQAEVLRARNVDRIAVETVPVLRELYRDQAVYAGALLGVYVRSFIEPTKMVADVVTEGGRARFEEIIDLVVQNTAIYGGAWVLARDTAPDDGVMEVVPFVSRRELFSKMLKDLSALPDLEEALEALGVEHSKAFSAAQIDISFLRPGRPEVASQVDGEEWVRGQRFRIAVRPNLLPVRTPQGFIAPWRQALPLFGARALEGLPRQDARALATADPSRRQR